MTNIIIAAVMLVALYGVYVFYAKFTKRGAIPLAKAWSDFTSWFSLALIAFAEWFVALGQWLAELWTPFQEQFGSALAADSMAGVIQSIGFAFMVLKLKAQKPLPKPELPSIPK